ncbi:MAG: gluconokinase [Rhizobiaceae bacterium]
MTLKSGKPNLADIRLFVVMGVAGCGKTTIGENLAAAIDGIFLDGDAFHPQSNIEKMSQGIALTDEDRWPWLETFAREIAVRPGAVIGGCSSLKRAYREHITQAAGEPVLFIYLDGSKELIADRMGKRQGHFMPTSLLDSQFATLEVPTADETAIHIDIDAPTGEIVRRIRLQINDNA